jgi:hypothetical protein
LLELLPDPHGAWAREGGGYVLFGIDAAEMARRLLDKPIRDVQRQTVANWTELLDPSTSLPRASLIYGVPAPPTLKDLMKRAGLPSSTRSAVAEATSPRYSPCL